MLIQEHRWSICGNVHYVLLFVRSSSVHCWNPRAAQRVMKDHTSTSWSSLKDDARPLAESAISSSGLTDDTPEMGLSFD